MGMKASEVGNWLRQYTGKCNHRQVLRDDSLVVRPGPNFHWLMGHPAAGQTLPSVPEQDSTAEHHREADNRAKRG